MTEARRWILAALGILLQAAPMRASAETSDPPTAHSALAVVAGSPAAAPSMTGTAGQAWFRTEWEAYKAKFLRSEGRFVENPDDGISSSAGQGAGLLLAALADDKQAFETVWGWTRANMMVGPAGLAARSWDPKLNPPADLYNATDGDILMAWALAKAARRFNRADYRTSAQAIARAIHVVAVRPSPRGPLLMPGATGFGRPAQPDGPVINPSTYVFPAFDELEELAPEHDWEAVRETGRKLIGESRFGPRGLPTDWLALRRTSTVPARNFPATFGYHAIRIPLYLAWAYDPSQESFARYSALWDDASKAVLLGPDPGTGPKPPTFGGAGYRLIVALSNCLVTGSSVPPELFGSRDELYDPSTLRLLAVALAQERYPQCL